MAATQVKHIPTNRLFDAAFGLRALAPVQRKHVHDCEFCQLIFKAFVTGVVENPPTAKAGNPTKAAA